MARICRKCFQVGCVIGLGIFLASHAPAPEIPEIEPQLTAGAARLPIVDWRTTEVDEKVNTALQFTVVTASEVVNEVNNEVNDEVNDVGEPTELIEDDPEPADDLLYRVVQAEGYTMGYEGMRYITSAILNLARDRGCSVESVLTSGAYTVVNTGAIWRQELLPETIAAVDDDLACQIDTEIKYFRTGHYHGFGEAVFNYGNVYFSK